MNFRHMLTVFKKEVKDLVRDRKTIMSNLVIPIILMPLLFTIMSGSMEKMEQDITENITVGLTTGSDTQEIRNLLEKEIFAGKPQIKLNGVFDDPVEAVRNNEVRFVLDVEKNFAANLEAEQPYSITVIYDQSDTKSSGSFGILAAAINEYSQKIVLERLAKKGIDTSILEPVKIVQSNAASEKANKNLMLMMILPMLISILVAVGGIPAATDLVAGEKERGTFEPLLTTQSSRMSILLGKYLTVTLFSIVSVISQFIGLAIGAAVSPGFFTMGGGGGDLSVYVPPLALVLIILITISLGMVFAALQLAVSTFAKSFKEAQTYLSFFIFVAMVPAYATMMMQPDDISLSMFFIPLLNSIASLKMVLGNVINYSYLGIALGTSAIYVVASLLFAASLFNKEQVLFRS
ncbi:MAG TPA: ABC transporter permease [Candidatus Atribacteria bacterium]|nr:ABC transporter permease [Candidatus Atribacteria bacterium]